MMQMSLVIESSDGAPSHLNTRLELPEGSEWRERESYF